MSILQKIEKSYSNLIESIKLCQNKEQKMIMIGSLAVDIGNRCISALAKIFGLSRITIRKAIKLFKKELPYKLEIETRGRKLLIAKYPNLKQDIEKIIEDSLSIDPHFKSEKQYVKMTIKEIKTRLIETGKYNDKSFSNSYLNDLVNQMGYGLKKVQKTKPLKKIEETNIIFENVHKKKKKL